MVVFIPKLDPESVKATISKAMEDAITRRVEKISGDVAGGTPLSEAAREFELGLVQLDKLYAVLLEATDKALHPKHE